jgi:hypothetical protein
MFEVKTGTTPRVPVRMLSIIDGIQGITGLSGSSCTLAITRSDGSTNTYASSTFTFDEITTGAFVNTGSYWLTLPSYATAVTGPVVYAVANNTGSARVFEGVVNVVADLASDIIAAIGTPVTSLSADIAAIQTKLGTPAGASVSTDIAAVKSELDTVNTTTSGTLYHGHRHQQQAGHPCWGQRVGRHRFR